MKKKILFILIPAALVAGFYLWPSKTTKEIIVQETSPLVSKNRKLFLGKRNNLVVGNATESLPSACSVLKDKLSALDLNLSFKEIINSLNQVEFQNCSEPQVKDRIQSLQKVCFEKFEKVECEANLLFVRAILRTLNVKEGSDLETIADLILTEFSKQVPDFKKLLKLSDQLLGIDPSNRTFQKVWAMSKLISQDNMRNLPEGFANEIYSRLDPEVVNDPELMGYRLFLETQLEPLKTEAYARDYVRDYPNRSESYEILGWSLWQQNRRGEALSALQRAMELNPKDKWLKGMYAKLKSPGSGPQDYKGRLNLGIRFEDIVQ